MVTQLKPDRTQKIIYPESDGKPMADNTVQFRWIMIIFYNLEWLFTNNPNVFIAGDLLWYPLEGQTKKCQAPDVMAVFGRPKGDRGSYQQWEEENIAPQVVFEIRSPSNKQTDLDNKLVFYNRHGVEEYYLYDPHRNDLSGWQRSEETLAVINPMDGWVSPRLQIRFDMSGDELQLYRPNGEVFATYTQIMESLESERQEKETALQEKEIALQEKETALQEKETVLQEKETALQENQQIQQELQLEKQENQRLKDLLKAARIDPNSLG